MEVKNATNEELVERRKSIGTEIDAPGADLDAIEKELREINDEIETRRRKEEMRKRVAGGEGVILEKAPEAKKETKEFRNSDAYIKAFAEYVRTGKDYECRKLMTENVATGTVPVPTFVGDIVAHAWEREGLMRRIKKMYLKGNLKMAFEISGADAAIHTEGGDAVAEETLVTGIVELKPQTIKKWVSITDEVLTMDDRTFLEYVYEEITYRIAKKAAKNLIDAIKAAPATSTTTAVGIPVMTVSAITLGLVAEAIANLSDEAENPIIVMNKLTWAAMKEIKYESNYGADPFEGLDVEFTSELPAFSAATTGVTFMLVGDFASGATANLPGGDGIEFKFDDKTLMTQDLVRILGRQEIAVGVTAPGRFVKVTAQGVADAGGGVG